MATSLLRLSTFRVVTAPRQFIVGAALNTKSNLVEDSVKSLFLDKLKVTAYPSHLASQFFYPALCCIFWYGARGYISNVFSVCWTEEDHYSIVYSK